MTGYAVWGLIYSVQAPFYADEALRRGANLSQVHTPSFIHLRGVIFCQIIQEWQALPEPDLVAAVGSMDSYTSK